MNAALQVLDSLHTTHGNFSDRPLAPDDLGAILHASVRAANASNAQNYAIVVVEDPAVMQLICGYRAAVTLVYCADTQRNIDMAEHLGCEYSPDPAWLLTTCVVDAALAAQNAVVAATSMGVDSLITNGIHRGDPQRVWEALDLPRRNCLPVLALCLGYAEEPPPQKRGRLCDPGVVHWGRYCRPDAASRDRLVALYDDSANGLSDGSWRKQGHPNFLTCFFKGAGTRVTTAYRSLASALAAMGVARVSKCDQGSDAYAG
jgi:nitroreductase